MGWASFLEDIERRLDEAVRLYSPPKEARPGSVSVESLRDTNELLRRRNDELLRAVAAVRADLSSKKQTDFCKDECVRLRKANFTLAGLLKDAAGQAAPAFKRPPAQRQPEKAEPLPQHLREAKQRVGDARKSVEALKRDLKQAEKARARAETDYQKLLQFERNSTRFVHDLGGAGPKAP